MSTTAAKRAYRYRFHPTSEQEQLLRRTMGCARLVYNKALEERARAWFERQERVGYAETSAMLTAWKREDDLAFLNEVSSVPLQQSLRHLQAAFANFYAKRARYPKFKSRRRSRASIEYTSSAFSWRGGELKLAKMAEPLAITWSRPLPEGAEPSTVTVSVDPAGRWHVSMLVEERIAHLPATDRTVGVDVGISALATLSTGEKIANPRHEQRDREKLAKAQRRLARTRKGSANREKARRKVARIHARIQDRRTDHLHKLSTRLIRENQAVMIEDLCVRGMLSRRSTARAISDASWRRLREMLEYKAGWYGRELVAVDRFEPTTRRCSACGWIRGAVPLGIRSWTCGKCGSEHDRDVNAAVNIHAAGLAVSACGGGVRPRRAEARKAAAVETGRSRR